MFVSFDLIEECLKVVSKKNKRGNDQSVLKHSLDKVAAANQSFEFFEVNWIFG
jgi:hypothetical protein